MASTRGGSRSSTTLVGYCSRSQVIVALAVGLLCLLCVQTTNAESHKSIVDFYNSLSAGDQEALGQLVLSNPPYKRKSPADPNFLRFGKRAPAAGDTLQQLNGGREPNFLRFGKRADPSAAVSNNFLRFGRSLGAAAQLAGVEEEAFERENRKPNFLRFG